MTPLTFQDKLVRVYLSVLDAYDSDGHLSGYSIRTTEYDNSLDKWAEAVGIDIKMIEYKDVFEVCISLTLVEHQSKPLIDPDDGEDT
jgi:hypothetical protein